jgi:recombinational DNA repair protein RecT
MNKTSEESKLIIEENDQKLNDICEHFKVLALNGDQYAVDTFKKIASEYKKMKHPESDQASKAPPEMPSNSDLPKVASDKFVAYCWANINAIVAERQPYLKENADALEDAKYHLERLLEYCNERKLLYKPVYGNKRNAQPCKYAFYYRSLWDILLKATRNDLSLNPRAGHCLVYPEENSVYFEPMVDGLCHKLKQAGIIKRIDTGCVYEGDGFEGRNGVPPVHTINNLEGYYKDLKLAYAVFYLTDGSVQTEYCRLIDIRAAKEAAVKKNGGSTWERWLPMMARKFAINRGANRLVNFAPSDDNHQIEMLKDVLALQYKHTDPNIDIDKVLSNPSLESNVNKVVLSKSSNPDNEIEKTGIDDKEEV